MGGNASKEDVSGTIAAYTLYGFGCSRCSNPPVFLSGSPGNTCCGTSCVRIEFDPPTEAELQTALAEFETHLDEAAEMAMETITWCSHVVCSGVDGTAQPAAEKLNRDWCATENANVLTPVGLRCSAHREVYGFGRSRVKYLVLRVYRCNK
mmetsp:Transcript_12428/g.34491  ORF Transcript_12428/g.34491 Transcript_12428/m.34491 type:complete len:151 (+) Transcript_12428:156-608(+)